jgi:hypothetical protein
MLYRFHVNIYALPDGLITGGAIELRGLSLARLSHADGLPLTFDSYFPVTFEQAADALGRLPRLDAEPDGYFLVSGDSRGQRWHDGHLFDFGGRLHRVELHGACPPESLDSLLTCFGWPQMPLAFELVREGVALDEAAFRCWAAASPVEA